MKLGIERWGDDLAVRLPQSLVERFKLKEGDVIDSEAFESALTAAQIDEAQRRREQALADIGNTRWALPADWKFDRDEANER